MNAADRSSSAYDTQFDHPQTNPPAEDVVVRQKPAGDLLVLVKALARSWPIILLLAIAGAVVGFGFASALPKRYFAEAVILIQPQRNPLDPNAPAPLASPEVVRSQLEVIRSRRVIDRVIRQQRLLADPEFVKQGEAGDRADIVAEEVASRLALDNDGRSFAIKIGVEASSAAKASRLADAFAAAYLAEQREQKKNAGSVSTEGLRARLVMLREEVFAAERAAEAYRRRNGLVLLPGINDGEGDDSVAMSPESRELSEISREMARLTAERARAAARAGEARNQARQNGGRGSPDVQSSPIITNLIAQEQELARREAELAQRYKPGFPLYDQVREQRASVRRALAREIGNVQTSVQSQAVTADAALNQTRRRAANLQRAIDDDIAASVTYRQLVREAKVRRTVYEELAQQVGRLSERALVQVPDAVLVSGASIPLKPVSPKPILIIALGFLGGLILGIAWALLRAWRTRTVLTERS